MVCTGTPVIGAVAALSYCQVPRAIMGTVSICLWLDGPLIFRHGIFSKKMQIWHFQSFLKNKNLFRLGLFGEKASRDPKKSQHNEFFIHITPATKLTLTICCWRRPIFRSHVHFAKDTADLRAAIKYCYWKMQFQSKALYVDNTVNVRSDSSLAADLRICNLLCRECWLIFRSIR